MKVKAKKILMGLPAMLFALMMMVGPVAPAFAATGSTKSTSTTTSINSSIYNQTSDNILATKVQSIVKIVGGVGGAAFVLAVLVIALFIIFGSISAHNVGTYWKAFFSCLAGAFIFFSAYAFAPAIAALAFK